MREKWSASIPRRSSPCSVRRMMNAWSRRETICSLTIRLSRPKSMTIPCLGSYSSVEGSPLTVTKRRYEWPCISRQAPSYPSRACAASNENSLVRRIVAIRLRCCVVTISLSHMLQCTKIMFLSKHATGMPCGRGGGDYAGLHAAGFVRGWEFMDVMYGCYVM